MVDMSGGGSGIQRSSPDLRGMSDFDLGMAITSVFTALLLGLALDYRIWWLGVPSGLATLLLASVFARRHIFKAHPKPLIGPG